MQITGKSETALYITVIAVVCVMGFGSGFFVGRQFPAHRFEKIENSHYLYDTSTGHVCDFLPVQANQQTTPATSFYERIASGANTLPPCN
jgi:hypothetical protein